MIPYKPDGSNVFQSVAIARKITLTADSSTTTAEYFRDEARRLVLNTTTPWTPSDVLIDGNAQVQNNVLLHPAVGDYPGFVAAEQEYQRKFSKVSASNGTITFSGIAYTDVDPYNTGDLNILIQLDGDNVFFDLGRVVGDDNGTGSGDSRANSIGARVSGSGGGLNFSLSTYSTGGVNGNEYRIIVIFRNTNHSIFQMVTS